MSKSVRYNPENKLDNKVVKFARRQRQSVRNDKRVSFIKTASSEAL